MCEKVYGIYLPPYFFTILSVLTFMLIEFGTISLITRVNECFSPIWTVDAIERDTIQTAEELRESEITLQKKLQEGYKVAKTLFVYLQIAYAVSTFLYDVYLEISGSHLSRLWQYENVFGRALNSSLFNTCLALSIDGASLGTTNRDKCVEKYKDCVLNHSSSFVELYCGTSHYFAYHEPLQELLLKLGDENVMQINNASKTQENDNAQQQQKNPIHSLSLSSGRAAEDDEGLVLDDKFSSTSRDESKMSKNGDHDEENHHEQQQQRDQDQNNQPKWKSTISAVEKEELWLEMCFLLDCNCISLYIPLFARLLFVLPNFILFRVVHGMFLLPPQLHIGLFPTLTYSLLSLARSSYYSIEYLKEMNLLNKLIFCVLIFIPAFFTNMIVGIMLYGWFFFVVAVVFYVLLVLLRRCVMTPLVSSLFCGGREDLAVKLLLRIVFCLLFQTSYNYAFFLYSGKGYLHVVVKDWTARCTSEFFEESFSEVSQAFVFLNWL